MGSRMMHLLISHRVSQQIRIENKASFIAGGIAPDAVSPKERSHFYEGEVNDYSRSINYAGFLKKYGHNSPYLLGYYSHLIADDLWLKGFYLPWLKNRMKADSSLFTRYHQDFGLLNAKLLQVYPCSQYLKNILMKPIRTMDLEEVSHSQLTAFIPSAIEDLNAEPSLAEKPLRVFTVDQIVGYIETAADQSVQKIKPLINGFQERGIQND
ncbi:zinc dependent phospholipase C family protein [Jeotgalibacillus sp. ET6]|uniref:zinc dependent phospholipase C family protein n=1 Tax=Jeotgalibacillus sp. ET6 TaxID=3037260 RepID=UPI002418AA48|nr:zinc dependent phospholipase C family protein [Jeotgalibacillus sp. ET6]MDG5472287.1 zinc dependent phospholipase C family protein [Jeotgalibacillus sp. ET6]